VIRAVEMNASKDECRAAYNFMNYLFDEFHYEVGVFINIGMRSHHLNSYSGKYSDRLIVIGIEPVDDGFIAQSAVIMDGVYCEQF
jgi:hypothetical protein